MDEQEVVEPAPITITKDGLAPWSESKIKAAEKCPHHFAMKYIFKHKVSPEIIRGSEGQLMTDSGLAAHQVLETLMIAPDMPMHKAYSKIRSEFKEKFTDDEWSNWVAPLEFNIGAFRDRIENFITANPIKRVYTEQRVGLTRDWKPTGFFADDCYFRGVMDLSLHLKNNDFLVIDHKKGPPPESFRFYLNQLNNYKILCHFGIENCGGAQSGVHFIAHGAVRLDEYVKAREIEQVLVPRLLNRMDDTVEAIVRQGYFAKNKGCSLCKYCEYAPDCKAGYTDDFIEKSVIESSENDPNTKVVKFYKRPTDFDQTSQPKTKLKSVPKPAKAAKLDGLD